MCLLHKCILVDVCVGTHESCLYNMQFTRKPNPRIMTQDMIYSQNLTLIIGSLTYLMHKLLKLNKNNSTHNDLFVLYEENTHDSGIGNIVGRNANNDIFFTKMTGKHFNRFCSITVRRAVVLRGNMVLLIGDLRKLKHLRKQGELLHFIVLHSFPGGNIFVGKGRFNFVADLYLWEHILYAWKND
ncbi:hypothetical protein ACS0TY_035771 [Phlomoides rotata]